MIIKYQLFMYSPCKRCISGPCQTSKMKRLAKIVSRFKSLTIFAEHFILDVWKGCLKCVTAYFHFSTTDPLMSQSLDILNIFNTLTLKQVFWKSKTIFKKLKQRFLVESTKIENATFSQNAAVKKVNFLESTK